MYFDEEQSTGMSQPHEKNNQTFQNEQRRLARKHKLAKKKCQDAKKDKQLREQRIKKNIEKYNKRQQKLLDELNKKFKQAQEQQNNKFEELTRFRNNKKNSPNEQIRHITTPQNQLVHSLYSNKYHFIKGAEGKSQKSINYALQFSGSKKNQEKSDFLKSIKKQSFPPIKSPSARNSSTKKNQVQDQNQMKDKKIKGRSFKKQNKRSSSEEEQGQQKTKKIHKKKK